MNKLNKDKQPEAVAEMVRVLQKEIKDLVKRVEKLELKTNESYSRRN